MLRNSTSGSSAHKGVMTADKTIKYKPAKSAGGAAKSAGRLSALAAREDGVM
jgi:hypothetical protein